ncbi:MAG: N-sulfoglucosamine sulfohydrolase, partial [Gaiellaceae bacterium]|nr:N-sulfoglucosamine sulfohydrolase [Gaiellaceae bacterium]
AEGSNLAADAASQEVLAELRARLDAWMRKTDDPLLEGPVEPPPGAAVNEPWQVSPSEPPRLVTAGPTAAPSR